MNAATGIGIGMRPARAAALALVGLLGLWPGSPMPAVAAESIAGKLLVASESMGDPTFRETVIYMVEHDENGAMGLVVNRPMGEMPIADLLEHLGLEAEGVEGGIEVYFGGPVERGRGFLLHTTDVLIAESVVVDGGVALTARPEMLDALARGEGPSRALFMLGYSGWAPGQLESELARHDWFVIPSEPTLVFAEDPAASWKRALARRSIEL